MTDLPFSYRVRRSQRAKKLRIAVKPDLVEVVMPSKMAESQAHQFVIAQRDWIIAAIDKVKSKQRRDSLPPPENDTDTVWFKGQATAIHIRPAQRQRIAVEWQDDLGFVVHVPPALAADAVTDPIKQAVFDWMFAQAHRDIHFYINKHAPKHRLFPSAIRLRTQKSRWGSCSHDNILNLNALLMLTPPEVMEYVVVHELCHIRHKNHSLRFWQLVSDHLPHYQQQRAWLKTYGSRVMQQYHG